MDVKKAIKRVAALGIGTSMLGATMFSALAAADLSTYPEPFVKDGDFNALIVVGESAATQDVLGAIDIATSLQYASKTTTTVNTGTAATITASGDAKKIVQSTDNLEFNETLSPTSVIEGDLQVLADGSISNEYGSFDYEQTIDLPDGGRLVYEADVDDDTSTLKPYFKIPANKRVYTYKVTFTPALKSDHNTGSGGYLEDIKNKKITLLGKEYTILKADHSAQNNTELTLMAGAVSDVLQEGASKTYTIKDVDYDVTLDFVGTSEAKFTVNGEVTNSLQEGDTHRLADGSEIGVVDILAQEFAGGLRKVEFDLGASKVKIADAATQTQNWGATVTVGTEDLSAVEADIVTSTDEGITHGCDVAITSLEFRYNSSEVLYLGVDQSAADIADTNEYQEGNFLFDGFDFVFRGLEIGATEEIKLEPSGSKNYKLTFTNKGGIEYNTEVFAINSTSVTLGRMSGSTMRDMVRAENVAINDEDYFFVNKNQYSHILQYKDIVPGSDTTDNTGTLRIRDAGSGTVYEVTYSGATREGTLNLDGNSFKIKASADNNGASIMADMDGDGSYGTTVKPVELWTKYGANITLGGHMYNSSARILTSTTDENAIVITSEDDEDNQKDMIYTDLYINSDSDLDINDSVYFEGFAGAGYNPTMAVKDDDNDYLYQTYTGYGIFVENDRIGSGTSQNKFKVVYPDNQVFGAFFVEAGAVDVSESSGEGVIETQQITKIDVGSAVLDTDPAVAGKEKQKNLIVVGGPAINKAAAVLMDKPFPSYGAASGIPENAGLIKLVEQTDGNVALIVAGWEADDSQRAARVVADYETYQEAGTLSGTEVQVTGTSLTDITVGAVVLTEDEVEEIVEETAEEAVEEAVEESDATMEETA